MSFCATDLKNQSGAPLRSAKYETEIWGVLDVTERRSSAVKLKVLHSSSVLRTGPFCCVPNHTRPTAGIKCWLIYREISGSTTSSEQSLITPQREGIYEMARKSGNTNRAVPLLFCLRKAYGYSALTIFSGRLFANVSCPASKIPPDSATARAAGSARSHFHDVQCSTARIKGTRGTRYFAPDALPQPVA